MNFKPNTVIFSKHFPDLHSGNKYFTIRTNSSYNQNDYENFLIENFTDFINKREPITNFKIVDNILSIEYSESSDDPFCSLYQFDHIDNLIVIFDIFHNYIAIAKRNEVSLNNQKLKDCFLNDQDYINELPSFRRDKINQFFNK